MSLLCRYRSGEVRVVLISARPFTQGRPRLLESCLGLLLILRQRSYLIERRCTDLDGSNPTCNDKLFPFMYRRWWTEDLSLVKAVLSEDTSGRHVNANRLPSAKKACIAERLVPVMGYESGLHTRIRTKESQVDSAHCAQREISSSSRDLV